MRKTQISYFKIPFWFAMKGREYREGHNRRIVVWANSTFFAHPFAIAVAKSKKTTKQTEAGNLNNEQQPTAWQQKLIAKIMACKNAIFHTNIIIMNAKYSNRELQRKKNLFLLYFAFRHNMQQSKYSHGWLHANRQAHTAEKLAIEHGPRRGVAIIAYVAFSSYEYVCIVVTVILAGFLKPCICTKQLHSIDTTRRCTMQCNVAACLSWFGCCGCTMYRIHKLWVENAAAVAALTTIRSGR